MCDDLMDEVLKVLQYIPNPSKEEIDVIERFTKFLYPEWQPEKQVLTPFPASWLKEL